MENGILNSLQIGRGKWFSDLIDENKISEAMLSRPYDTQRVISYVFASADDGYNTSLDAITGGLGNVMSITNREYEWRIVMDEDRAVTIFKASVNGELIDMNNADTILAGLAGAPIQLWLQDKW